MKNRLELLILFIYLLTVFSCGDSAGIVDETDTEITAVLVDTSGKRLRNVPVRLYNHRDSIYLDSLITDSMGTFSVNTEQLDTFTIWAETDSSALFRGNIILEKDQGGYSGTDTLKPRRNIYVPIEMQPQHFVRMLKAHILGTHIHPSFSTDTSSFMILKNVPDGIYNIMIEKSVDTLKYSPTTPQIEIFSFTPDTLTDTVVMPYYGTPIVTGIEATYDTANGTAYINWEKSSFENVGAYHIYRAPANYITLPSEPIASTSDTFFLDTTLSDTMPPGEYSYLVRIKNSNEEDFGGFKHKDTINFVHPSKEFDIVTQTLDTIYLNHPVSIPLNISEWFGDTPAIAYQLGNTSFAALTTPNLEFIYTDSYEDSVQCILRVNGRDTTIYDTLYFYVSSKWENSGDAFITNGTFQKPVYYNNMYYTTVIDGEKQKLFTSTDGTAWTSLSDSISVTYDSSQASNLAVCLDKLWLLDGNSLFFSSTDGVTWTTESTTPIKSPWSLAAHESRIIHGLHDSLEILFENSEQYSNGGTQLTHFTYIPETKELHQPLLDVDKNLYPEAYWLVYSETSPFQIYVYEKREKYNPKFEIVRYDIGLEGITESKRFKTENGASSYITWDKTPRMAACFYRDGLYLSNGFGKSIDLHIQNEVIANNDDIKTIRRINTPPALEDVTNLALFTTSKGLNKLSTRGVFQDYK